MSDTRQQAVSIVLAERERQITKENWSVEHDDTHFNAALGLGGASYALAAASKCQVTEAWRDEYLKNAERIFPFERGEWWKPSPNDPLRDLAKAGAFILAEIERLLRAKQAPPPKGSVRCNQCEQIVVLREVGMAFNMGHGAVYICSNCAPPATAQEAAAMLVRFMDGAK